MPDEAWQDDVDLGGVGAAIYHRREGWVSDVGTAVLLSYLVYQLLHRHSEEDRRLYDQRRQSSTMLAWGRHPLDSLPTASEVIAATGTRVCLPLQSSNAGFTALVSRVTDA